jgi:hypothetical protein
VLEHNRVTNKSEKHFEYFTTVTHAELGNLSSRITQLPGMSRAARKIYPEKTVLFTCPHSSRPLNNILLAEEFGNNGTIFTLSGKKLLKSQTKSIVQRSVR